MEWGKLLCEKRVKEVFDGELSASPRVKGDVRTEFRRDYDRAVFSTPVRRLQDKTQVFLLEPHDAVRTRLTHSLEVSTLARDMAHSVSVWMVENEKLEDRFARPVEEIAGTCGLIHDLGNPPFGHAGERAISNWFAKRHEKDPNFFKFEKKPRCRVGQMTKDFLNFEGNAQTLRLISRLQVLSDFRGLNLTLGTISAACKYTAASDAISKEDHARAKPGFFTSESELIDVVRKETGTGEARNPITFLVEASDDIVYATVDLEDGVKKGVVSWDELAAEIEKEDESKTFTAVMDRALKYVQRGKVNLGKKEYKEALSQAFRIYATIFVVPAVCREFQRQYDDIIAGEYTGELALKCSETTLINACQRVARRLVYKSPETLRLEVMGRKVIQDLMDLFWEAAEKYAPEKMPPFSSKLYELMSSNYRLVFENALKEGKLPPRYCRIQLVTDYICGMTDTFACTLHRKLTNG